MDKQFLEILAGAVLFGIILGFGYCILHYVKSKSNKSHEAGK